MKKSKHNYWIDGLEKGTNFFEWIQVFGYAFIFLILIFSAGLFLVFFAIEHPEYANMVVLLLKVLRFGVWMFAIGFIFKYLCGTIANILSEKEMEAIEKEAYGNRKKKYN